MLTDRNFDYRNAPQDADAADMPGRPESPFAVVPPNTTFGGGSGSHGGNDACRLVMANLSAYLDNELDPDQERVIEGHLSQCAECASNLVALQTTDRLLQREWRDSSPLPSSLHFKQSVDAIMASLPPVPGEQTAFASKRVHSRARWMRFSTGLAGVVAFLAMLWSSYRIGYAHGRMSLHTPSLPSPADLPSSRTLSEPHVLSAAFTSSFASMQIPAAFAAVSPHASYQRPPLRYPVSSFDRMTFQLQTIPH
jgi:hypothetical protein